MVVWDEHMKPSPILIILLFIGFCCFQQSCSKRIQDIDLPQTDTLTDLSKDTTAITSSEINENVKTIYTFSVFPSMIYAFNASDGKLKWSAPAEGSNEGSLLATPNIVAFIGSTKKITAFDTSGNPKWTFDLGLRDRESPRISHKSLIFGESREFIFAINASNGIMKWKFTKPVNGCGGTGRLHVMDSTLFSCGCNLLMGIDIETGMLKWKVEGIPGFATAQVFKTKIFVASDSHLYIFDTQTGNLINDYPSVLEVPDINIKYGRIYQSNGNVLDSADPTLHHPRIQPVTEYYDWLHRGPLLADGKAMGVKVISDAITGAEYCEPVFEPDFSSTRGHVTGATYLNGMMYYVAASRWTYSGTKEIHYSDLYAFDVARKTLKWRTVIPDPGMINQAPCIVTQEGGSFRRTEVFR